MNPICAMRRCHFATLLAFDRNRKATLPSAPAASVEVRPVEKDDLFSLSDILSIHVVLRDRTRGLALTKPESYLINTSRGPIVVESDLIAALRSGRMVAALGQFAIEHSL